MKLDLSNTVDLNKFEAYQSKLVYKKAKVELRELKGKRTLSQNNYLHVVLTIWSINFGYTLEEAKTKLKRDYEKVNQGFFIYKKNGEAYLKSSADLDTKEATKWIDWIRETSATQGQYIPTSEEYLLNQYAIDKELEINRKYL